MLRLLLTGEMKPPGGVLGMPNSCRPGESTLKDATLPLLGTEQDGELGMRSAPLLCIFLPADGDPPTATRQRKFRAQVSAKLP